MSSNCFFFSCRAVNSWFTYSSSFYLKSGLWLRISRTLDLDSFSCLARSCIRRLCLSIRSYRFLSFSSSCFVLRSWSRSCIILESSRMRRASSSLFNLLYCSRRFFSSARRLIRARACCSFARAASLWLALGTPTLSEPTLPLCTSILEFCSSGTV